MSNDQEKSKPIERKSDASDKTKQSTSQKTATESISDEKQAKRHSENFDSISTPTTALGHHVVAEHPLVLHDSTTGETLYDATRKRHEKVLNSVSSDANETSSKKPDDGNGHLKAGERLLQMEQALRADKSRTDDKSKDFSSVSHKALTQEPRPESAPQKVSRRNERGDAARTPVSGSARSEAGHDALREKQRVDQTSDTTGGVHSGPIKQEFSAWIPDYKTIGSPAALPKLVEVHMAPSDNAEIERHYKDSLHGREERTLTDFDRTKLRNLAICDVAIDKYQTALTKSELNDTRYLPDPVRGLMLAGAALQDGAALGATKAVFHKVIEGGAIGDLASGTAMGLAFGKVVATLAANVNPWTRAAATLMRTGGVALAIKEIGQIGTQGIDGLMKSIPALDEVCKHPSEKTFANAKQSIEEHLGDPLADAALVGLGFAAAHGIEKAIPGGAKGGGKSNAHEGESGTGAKHGDAGNKAHPERASGRHEGTEESRIEEHKHQDSRHEKPRVAKSEYKVENKTSDGYRIIKCGEHEERMLLQDKWFKSVRTGKVDAESPIKIHVLTNSASDLGNVQRALIPELMKDPVLLKHVAQWKGQDPSIGFNGEAHIGAVAPTGIGQGAKGFTIYTSTAEDAIIVQRRIDTILHQKGLSLAEEFSTGNTETCPGLSKRASICRDTFAQAHDSADHYGPVIDEAVARNINSRYGLKPNDKLSLEQLRDLEHRTGVLKGAITYSADGRLMVKGHGGVKDYHGGYYATESGISTAAGQRVERPALYAIYRACGFDPCDVAIIWKK